MRLCSEEQIKKFNKIGLKKENIYINEALNYLLNEHYLFIHTFPFILPNDKIIFDFDILRIANEIETIHRSGFGEFNNIEDALYEGINISLDYILKNNGED